MRVSIGSFAPTLGTNLTVTFRTLATGATTNFATASSVLATNATYVTFSINNHKPPAINSRASTGCGYRLGCLGAGLLQPVLPEVSAQMRLRSESVEFGPS